MAHFEWIGHRFGWAGVEREHTSTFWRILSLKAVQAIWDYVCRRFVIVDAEIITKLVGAKLPRVSDLISLDARRSERMHHPAAAEPTLRVRMGQSSFRRISRIYDFSMIFDAISDGNNHVCILTGTLVTRDHFSKKCATSREINVRKINQGLLRWCLGVTRYALEWF